VKRALEHGDGSEQFKQDLQSMGSAKRLRDLLDGKIQDPQQVQEATALLARLMTGGTPHEGTMHSMVPKTASMDLTNALQYITGQPHDAGVRSFLDYMAHTADREEKGAFRRVVDSRLRGVRGLSLARTKPDIFAELLKPYTLTPDDVTAFDGSPTALESVLNAIEGRHKVSAAPKAALKPPPPGMVRVRIDGEVGLIPKDKLEDAKLKHKAEVVQ
jgi:hypothetical protein